MVISDQARNDTGAKIPLVLRKRGADSEVNNHIFREGVTIWFVMQGLLSLLLLSLHY